MAVPRVKQVTGHKILLQCEVWVRGTIGEAPLKDNKNTNPSPFI